MRWSGLLARTFSVGVVFCAIPVHATEAQMPWECSGYSGNAHTRCLQAYIELQRDKIAKLEGAL